MLKEIVRPSGQIQATLNPPDLVKVQRLPPILCLYRLFSLWESALLIPSKMTIDCDIIPVSLHVRASVQNIVPSLKDHMGNSHGALLGG